MPVRFGAIGFAHAHLEEFLTEGVLRHEEAELSAIADSDPKRLAGARAKFDVEAFPKASAVLARDDIDAIAVAAPNHQRPNLVARALRAGKHVFCEKPLAITEHGLDKIRATVRRSGKHLYLHLADRFTEPFVLLHELVSGGRIGRVTSIISSNPRVPDTAGRPDPATAGRYGGIICDLLVGRVDLVRWISGQDVVSSGSIVSSFGVAGQRAFDEAASAVLLLKDEVHVLLHTSWLAPAGCAPLDHFTVYGLRGSAAVAHDGKLIVSTPAGTETLSPKGENPNLLMCDDFIRLIQGGRSRLSTHDGVAATSVTLAIKRSVLKR